MADEIAFRASNLTTSYGEFEIKDANLYLEPGDIMGLVGKSGSGKSTLIDTFLGQKTPDEGGSWVEVDGEEVDIREVVGYSPQENSLYSDLSVRENLKTFGKLRGIESEELAHRIEFLLERMGIYGAIDKRVNQLSGGMAKRADLAAALLHDPDLLILDEPFTGIDPPQRRFLWKTVNELADNGKIVIITSHILKDLSRNCNKYGLIDDGKFYNTDQILREMTDQNHDRVEEYLNEKFRS